MLKVGDKVKLNKNHCKWVKQYGLKEGDEGVVSVIDDEIFSIGVIFKNRDGRVYQMASQLTLVGGIHDLLFGANKSRLSTALGKHRSYLNKMIQQGVSEETYQKIKAKLKIDWNSDKPLYVNDRKHLPFTIKPINCTLPKHKEWLQNLMMQGCIKL